MFVAQINPEYLWRECKTVARVILRRQNLKQNHLES